MGHVLIYAGILLEFWVECWRLILLAKSLPKIERQAQILQNTYNKKIHQIQSPHASPLISLRELLDKMHSWFLYVHALYTMVGSSWGTLWNGLPKYHTHRKSRPLRRETPHWEPIKKGISIFRLAGLTTSSDACRARVIFKKTQTPINQRPRLKPRNKGSEGHHKSWVPKNHHGKLHLPRWSPKIVLQDIILGAGTGTVPFQRIWSSIASWQVL